MLQAERLAVQRGGRTVLTDVDLEVRPGEVLGVLGPNGSGKSTLLAALSGELAAVAGRVSLHGLEIGAWPALERARHLAVLPQGSTLDFAFRVEEIVGMGRLPHASGKQCDEQIVEQVLGVADVRHLLGRSYLTLSGGERQRVHLARVLAQLWPGGGEQVLLLDEPTSALDPLHQHTTLQAVREFAARGPAVLLVLHDLNLAARYCDRILLLAEGRAQAFGTPREVLQPAPLKAVFGLDVLVQDHPERGYPLVVAR
jgi:iron complex transport system ATP-binding protein